MVSEYALEKSIMRKAAILKDESSIQIHATLQLSRYYNMLYRMERFAWLFSIDQYIALLKEQGILLTIVQDTYNDTLFFLRPNTVNYGYGYFDPAF